MPRLKIRPDNSSQEEFVPCHQDIKLSVVDDKKSRRKKLQRKQAMLSRCKGHCEGAWSEQQNTIYVQFLQDNLKDFETQYLRRSKKVFFRLSEILPQRTSEQCRSHHQKLQKQTDKEDPREIINYLMQRMSLKKQKKQIKTQLDHKSELEEEGFKIIEQHHKNTMKIFLNLQFFLSW